VVSQISLAVPLIALYEISIVMAGIVERKRAKQDAELAEEIGDDTDEAAAAPAPVQK